MQLNCVYFSIILLKDLIFIIFQKDYETAARYYKRATDIKEQEAAYAPKGLSRRSSSGDTNSTVKNLMHV